MHRRGLQALAVVLSCLMVCDGSLVAQAKSGLKIVVVDGDGAINNIQTGAGHEPVVEVRDASDKPVAGAKVTFSLPASGPSGTFFGASRNVTVTTNERGRATGTGFRPNMYEGRFQIQVSATTGDQTAAATVTQSNALPGGGVNRAVNPHRKIGTATLLLILAAAGIGGGIAASKAGGGNSTTTTNTGTTITPGTVTVGTPR